MNEDMVTIKCEGTELTVPRSKLIPYYGDVITGKTILEPPVWQPLTCPECGKVWHVFNRCIFDPELFLNPVLICLECRQKRDEPK